jgi:uncharacterized NAD(P)/FAD-binding protein YdhS
MKTILIIGAGYSGAIMAALLLQNSAGMPVRILLANGSGKVARGMAYGTQSSNHTLNVPVGNMSAYDDRPGHFLDFVRRHQKDADAASFVSRSFYGDYLEDLLAKAELAATPPSRLERIYRQIVSLKPNDDRKGTVAQFDSGEVTEVQEVVLALGHFPSSNPPISDPYFYQSDRYIRDPWAHAKLKAIPHDASVLLIGTGLTAVDIALTLQMQSAARQVHAVSRRGLLPQYHRPAGVGHPSSQTPSVIWGDAQTLREQMLALRRYCRQLEQNGGDWREALAILRPATAALWHNYTDRERRRFIRHVQPYWDSHRHRIAPNVAHQIDGAIQQGVFNAYAGRVIDLKEIGENVEATIRLRHTGNSKTLNIGYVINCTGPCSDPQTADDRLVQQLLSDGLICADNLGLGLQVSDTCAVINAKGSVSDRMYYLGPWLKAKYWEATAVPDLRRFASKLAATLTET